MANPLFHSASTIHPSDLDRLSVTKTQSTSTVSVSLASSLGLSSDVSPAATTTTTTSSRICGNGSNSKSDASNAIQGDESPQNNGTNSNSNSNNNSNNENGSNGKHRLQHGEHDTTRASAIHKEPIDINQKTGVPSILIIYTGGTIGMKKQGNGSLGVEPGYLTQQMNDLPDFKSDEMPHCSVLEWDPILDSSDVTLGDWERLARQIEEVYYDYDSFVVLHGTDTMAYTACALSFMLENLAKPVIITGSLIPFADVYNDARRNLIVSVLYAARFDIPEVCIFFNNQLLRGNRASKVDTFGLSAFASPNFPPLGTLGTELSIRLDLLLPQPKKRFRVHTQFEANVAVLRLTPGFSDDIVRNLLLPPLRGVVLEMYGVGNAPSKKAGLLKVLEEAVSRGVAIVVISQCSRGFVNLSTYVNGRMLKDQIGVMSGADMTPEAAATKLAFLLSGNFSKDQLRTLMESSIRGELSKTEGMF